MTNTSAVTLLTVCVLLTAYAQSLNTYDIIKRFEEPDERQSCPPQVNCAGKQNCSSAATCTAPLTRCCIDTVLVVACCLDPAAPTLPPPTTTTTTVPPPTTTATTATVPLVATTTTLPITTCTGLTVPCGPYTANEVNGCECESGADCYDNEVCCIDISKPPYVPLCRTKDPPPTTATTPRPGYQCPTSVLDKQCQRPATEGTPGEDCDFNENPPTCSAGQICCKKNRYTAACCLIP